MGLCVKQPLYATTLLHVRLEFWLVHFVCSDVIRKAILNWGAFHCEPPGQNVSIVSQMCLILVSNCLKRS